MAQAFPMEKNHFVTNQALTQRFWKFIDDLIDKLYIPEIKVVCNNSLKFNKSLNFFFVRLNALKLIDLYTIHGQ